MAAGTPSWPTLTEGQWNLIAANVTAISVDRLKSEYTFWRTYVATGVAAPIDAIKLKSPKLFEDANSQELTSSVAVDWYVWIENADTSVDSSPTNSIQVNL